MNEKELMEVKRVYAQAEKDLLSRISNRLQKDKSLEVDRWEQAKLQQLRKMRNGINNDIVKKLANYNDKELERLIEKAYKQGSDSTAADLKKVLDREVKEELTGTDMRAIRTLTEEYQKSLDSTHNRILRQSDDIYRRAVRKGAQYVNSGVGTRLEGAQKVLNDFANKGVSGFVDKSGRSWNLASYTEMATRTATGRAQVEGNINRLTQNDINLGTVSAHAESCPICDPWEGEILALNEQAKQETDYATREEAESDGLWHQRVPQQSNLLLKTM